MKMQIIKYACCGQMFAACLEPDCYSDKDWHREMRGYLKKGHIVETVESGTVNFGKCTCNEDPIKVQQNEVDSNQITIFT